jgi:hypothetical protein
MKMPTTSDLTDVTSGLFGLVLIGSGAWYWYNSNVQAQSTKQIAETAAREVRETAECHMDAFMVRPGSTEAALEIQAEFMDLCMAGAGIRLPSRLHRENARRRPWMESELQV